MHKLLQLIVIFSLVAISAVGVTIPVPIIEYLDQSKQTIRADLRKPFNDQDFALMAKKMAEKLIDRYASTIPDLPDIKNALQQELSQYILNTIFESFDKGETVEGDIPTNLKEIIKRITHVYPGTLSGNMLRINYKNGVLPLTLKLSGTDAVNIKLHGAPVKLPKGGGGYADQCLNLKINFEKNRSKIQWLGTTESACPLPVSMGEGEFLLNLAEDISKALLIKTAELLDQSRVLCKPSLTLVDLRTLRIFQNKTSWYQGKGYEPIDPTAQQEIIERAQSLRAIELSQFVDAVGRMKPNAESRLFSEKFAEYKEKVPKPEIPNSFASFMAWLWDNDCVAYSNMLNLLSMYEDLKNEDFTSYIKLELQKDLTK